MQEEQKPLYCYNKIIKKKKNIAVEEPDLGA